MSVVFTSSFSCSSNPSQIPWNEAKLLSLEISEGSCDIRYLEHVQVQVDLSFPRRGYLEMSFVSPSGTRSRLLYPRVIDSLTGLKNFTNWKVTSLHQWGENPIGKWNIIIRNTRKNRKTRQGNNNKLLQMHLFIIIILKSFVINQKPPPCNAIYNHVQRVRDF